MKRIVLTLAFLFGFIGLTAVSADDKPASSISMAENSWDFGNVSEQGGPVTHVFEFTNDGDAPLVILDARASCGCTKPKFTARPVEAGSKGEISVTFNPMGRPGEFTKTVTVKTNDPKKKKLTLRIAGVVIP